MIIISNMQLEILFSYST